MTIFCQFSIANQASECDCVEHLNRQQPSFNLGQLDKLAAIATVGEVYPGRGGGKGGGLKPTCGLLATSYNPSSWQTVAVATTSQTRLDSTRIYLLPHAPALCHSPCLLPAVIKSNDNADAGKLATTTTTRSGSKCRAATSRRKTDATHCTIPTSIVTFDGQHF